MWPARKRPPDERGIPIALQGDGTPNGYYIMSVRGTEVVMRYKAASRPAGYQMRITVAPLFEHATLGPAAPQNYNEAPIPRERLEAMELVVNLFDGGPRSRVWYRIDDSPAVEMTRSAWVNALVAKLSLRNPDRQVCWTPPDESAQIWATLRPGVRRAPDRDPRARRIRPGTRRREFDRDRGLWGDTGLMKCHQSLQSE
jgi:hypothetical protein